MSIIQTESGFANVDDAKLYYEVAGKGLPLVMLHAGVADSRQWNNEFAFFATHFRTLRYDLRGYGKSEPVDGAFSHINDLIALLDLLEIREPLVIMGCSMGGGVAMDFALAQPSRVKALIMVDAGPSGLHLDVPAHPKAADAGEAYNASQLDLVAELETQIWFDGMGRTAQEVNPAMRTLAYDMNRLGLSHDAKRLGTRLPDADTPAAERLATLDIPVLVIVGAHDTPYMLAAADYMAQKIRSARKAIIEDAAHLSNMDQPDEFQRIVKTFLDDLPG
jgi:pimeloyl-ACP methyl ester carboxylesterase